MVFAGNRGGGGGGRRKKGKACFSRWVGSLSSVGCSLESGDPR